LSKDRSAFIRRSRPKEPRWVPRRYHRHGATSTVLAKRCRSEN